MMFSFPSRNEKSKQSWTHTHMHIKEVQAQAHRSVSLSCWEHGHGKQILYVCCFADIQGLTHSSARQLTTACHSEEKTDQMLFFEHWSQELEYSNCIWLIGMHVPNPQLLTFTLMFVSKFLESNFRRLSSQSLKSMTGLTSWILTELEPSLWMQE